MAEETQLREEIMQLCGGQVAELALNSKVRTLKLVFFPVCLGLYLEEHCSWVSSLTTASYYNTVLSRVRIPHNE